MKKQFTILILSVIIALLPIFSTQTSAASNSIENQLSLLKGGISQVVIVTTPKIKSRTAVVTLYQKQNGQWKKAYGDMHGLVGKNGISSVKKEGDGKTPKGVFSLTTSFGTDPMPTGTKIPYKRVNKNFYWVDDVKSKDYNKMIYYRGNPNNKWNSYERLTHRLYSHAIVVNYNTNPIVKGKGSAIFLHTRDGSTKYTLGCVAMYKGHVKMLLQKLDPKLKPHIVISEAGKVNSTIKHFAGLQK